KVIRHDTVKSYGHMIARHKKLPNGLLSLSPILAPILLMVLSAIVDVTDWTGWGRSLVDFMGHPIMALAAGVFFAVLLLVLTKKAKDFNPITETTLKTAGPILCVTAASGVLGNIIANTITHSVCDYTYPEMVGFIAGNTGAMHGLGLFFPFLLAALIKTAQGSSTIAMVTTAGVMNPLMAVLGLDSVMMTALTIMAIGAGSMLISHANDSYFWVVAKLSGMSPRQAYASHTVTTAIAGVCCMVGVFVFSLFVS
ncbi:MAG: GntP family permease, partial [Treponema sp.]|nr:GntP family permease [Treponema sp.]